VLILLKIGMLGFLTRLAYTIFDLSLVCSLCFGIFSLLLDLVTRKPQNSH